MGLMDDIIIKNAVRIIVVCLAAIAAMALIAFTIGMLKALIGG